MQFTKSFSSQEDSLILKYTRLESSARSLSSQEDSQDHKHTSQKSKPQDIRDLYKTVLLTTKHPCCHERSFS